jgi:hypothetical protein
MPAYPTTAPRHFVAYLRPIGTQFTRYFPGTKVKRLTQKVPMRLMGTHFTGFTGTKVQKLTQKTLLSGAVRLGVHGGLECAGDARDLRSPTVYLRLPLRLSLKLSLRSCLAYVLEYVLSRCCIPHDIYMYTHTHKHTQTHTHTRTQTNIHTYMHTCIHK